MAPIKNLTQIVIVVVTLEILIQAVLIDYLPIDIATLLYVLCGLVICTLPFYYRAERLPYSFSRWNGLFLLGAGILSWMVLIHYGEKILSDVALDFKEADMLPTIRIMSERWINGLDPYAPIPQIWDGILPVYLPAMWLPYSVPDYLEIDIRWAGIWGVGLAISILLYTLWTSANGKSNLQFLIPVFVFLIFCIAPNIILIGYTQEGVVLFFYSLLVFAIIRQNQNLMGLTLTLCLLSRYLFIGWLLVFAIHSLINNKEKLFRIGSISVVVGLFLMVVSKAIYHLDIFYNLPAEFVRSLSSKKDKLEPVIESSLGFAKYIPYESLPQLHEWFLFLLFSIPIVHLGFWLRYAQKKRHELFLLCNLKLSILIFLQFLVLPFPYLFFTSSIISLGIVVWFCSPEIEEKFE